MKYPLGNPLVPYGTPLHVTELFLQVLKATFASFPEDHPYRYVEDDFERTGVHIDVSLNKESGIYGARPLIVVSRGGQSTSPTVVGDMASFNVPRNVLRGSSMVSSSINVTLLSQVKAETEILGQYVFETLLACRTMLPELLNIHMAEGVDMSEVSQSEDDDSMYVAQLTMRYVMQDRWRVRTDDPVLRGVAIAIDTIRERHQHHHHENHGGEKPIFS